jgi:hypothetical protein
MRLGRQTLTALAPHNMAVCAAPPAHPQPLTRARNRHDSMYGASPWIDGCLPGCCRHTGKCIDIREAALAIRHVSNAPSGGPEVLVRGRAGEPSRCRRRSTAGARPDGSGLPVGPGGVSLVAQDLGRAGQGLWFGQRVRVRTDVAHRDVTVTRSGLTCWLPNTRRSRR